MYISHCTYTYAGDCNSCAYIHIHTYSQNCTIRNAQQINTNNKHLHFTGFPKEKEKQALEQVYIHTYIYYIYYICTYHIYMYYKVARATYFLAIY